jgi:hypothetical protein
MFTFLHSRRYARFFDHDVYTDEVGRSASVGKLCVKDYWLLDLNADDVRLAVGSHIFRRYVVILLVVYESECITLTSKIWT